MGEQGLPAMTKFRQSALYSCTTNDAPMRGAGVLLAARIRPVSQLRVRALPRELEGTREMHVGVCRRLHSEQTRIDVKSVPWVGHLSWRSGGWGMLMWVVTERDIPAIVYGGTSRPHCRMVQQRITYT